MSLCKVLAVLSPLLAVNATQIRTFHQTPAACCIAIGPKGTVFAGVDTGLLAFDGAKWNTVVKTTKPVEALAANESTVVFAADGKLHIRSASGTWATREVPAKLVALALVGDEPVLATADAIYRGGVARFKTPGIRCVAASPNGSVAVGTADGLFELSPDNKRNQIYPRQSARSWAPTDVRAVAYDTRGKLHFADPQGAGVRETNGEWKLITIADGLPYDDFTTFAPVQDGSVWYGTKIGAIHYDGHTWEYRQGLRWLPDDDVRAIATKDGVAWFATPAGIASIERSSATLADKARFFEAEIDKRHRRTEYGYVLGVTVRKPGDAAEFTQHDSDNDGLWTAMYGAGECFACALNFDARSCERANAAFEALRFLGVVTQGGSNPAPRGFVARAILPTSGSNPNVGDSPEHDDRQRARDPLWKTIKPRWPTSADGKWYWKSDTSSDELDGHYFFYALYYDLAAKTEEQKRRVRDHVASLTDHLIEHNFQLIDHDGKVTRWGVFNPEKLNHDPVWWEERSLNSISILSYLKVSTHVTGDPKYARAAAELISQHSYAMNTLIPKNHIGPGAGNQSDDEMAFMCLYNLVRYEADPTLRSMYAEALRRRWEVEQPELCPLFNFIAGAGLDEAIDTLERFPLDRYNWALKNSHRKDIVLLSDRANETRNANRGHRRNGRVLPIDERYVDHWNHDPWRLDYSGDGRHLADGASFLLPYYMGLYQKQLK